MLFNETSVIRVTKMVMAKVMEKKEKKFQSWQLWKSHISNHLPIVTQQQSQPQPSTTQFRHSQNPCEVYHHARMMVTPYLKCH